MLFITGKLQILTILKNSLQFVISSKFFLVACVVSTVEIFIVDSIKRMPLSFQFLIISIIFVIFTIPFFYIIKIQNKKKIETSYLVFLAIEILVVARCVVFITIPYSKSVSVLNKEIQIIGFIESYSDVSANQVAFSNAFLKNDENNLIDNTNMSGGYVLLRTYLGKISFYEKSGKYVYGDIIKVKLLLTSPSMKRNPGGFDERKYYDSNGIYLKGAIVKGEEPMLINKAPNLFYSLAHIVRSRITKVFNTNLPNQEAGLMSGLLLGDRSNMSKEILAQYQKAGLSHITAVSGSAVTFLLVPLQFIFKKLKVSKRKKTISIFSVLIFFGFITGWSPSISRALLMFFILLISKELHKKTGTIQALFVSLTILIIINPIFSLNVGFWLSGLATAGIVHLSRPIENDLSKNEKSVEFLNKIIATGLAAGISVLPLAVYISGEISVSSVLSGLFVLPLVEFATIQGSVLALAGIINSNYFLTWLIAVPLKGILYSIEKVALFVSKIDILHFRTGGLSFYLIIAMTAFVIFVFINDKKIKKICFLTAISILITGIIHTKIIEWQKPDFEIIFADVGQGDSTLIMLKTGESILIDSGNRTKGYDSLKGILNYYGIKYPLIYIVTHTHEDHCGGIIELITDRGGGSLIVPYGTLERSNILKNDSNADGTAKSVSTTYKPPVKGENDLTYELIGAAYEKNMIVKEVSNCDEIKIGDKLSINFYNPEKLTPSELDENGKKNDVVNSSSLVMQIIYDGFKIMLMGDATAATENKITTSGKNISSNIYRISHHGSPTSTNSDIINAVNPLISIISVGKNLYGHPSPKVIDRLTNFGCEIRRTDEKGAIIFFIKDNKIRNINMIN